MNQSQPVALTLLLLPALAVAGCGGEAPPGSAEDASPEATIDQADTQDAVPPGAGVPERVRPDNADPRSEPIQTGEARVGAAAPDFVAMGLDGESVALSDFLGEQHVVLAFSRAHW